MKLTKNSYCIYKIVSPSNKIYIGVTNSFKRRMREHFSDWKNRKQKIALHNSFTKYGFENHKMEIIFDNLEEKYAYNLEKELIEKYNTRNSKIGLNSREGGKGGNMVDWNSENGKILINNRKKHIQKKYNEKWLDKIEFILNNKKTYTIIQLSKKLNVSASSLTNFLKNNNIKVERKSKYNLDEVAKEINVYVMKGMTNKKIMEITGYSNGTLCRAKQKLQSIDNK